MKKRFIFKISFICFAFPLSSCLFQRVPFEKTVEEDLNRYINYFKCKDAFIYVAFYKDEDFSSENRITFSIKDDSKALLRMVQTANIEPDPIAYSLNGERVFPYVTIAYGFLTYWPSESQEYSYYLRFSNVYDYEIDKTCLFYRHHGSFDSLNDDFWRCTMNKIDAEKMLDFCFVLIPEFKEKYDLATEEWQKTYDKVSDTGDWF